ncbi:hypothetical protein HY639_02980 [Candidatus Woesearchaeota archaeon]|nr:hypothetical protein [Candidatus Woesearchaeota archaeon]
MNVKKGLAAGMVLLGAVQARVAEIMKSKEARAFGRKLKAEAGKDTARVQRALKRRALRAIDDCTEKLARARAMLEERKK